MTWMHIWERGMYFGYKSCCIQQYVDDRIAGRHPGELREVIGPNLWHRDKELQDYLLSIDPDRACKIASCWNGCGCHVPCDKCANSPVLSDD